MAVQARSRSKMQAETTYTVRDTTLWRKRVSKTLIYVLLIVLALVFLAPLLWMLSTALKTEGDVSLFPPIIASNPPQWYNFVTALSKVPIPQYMLNTVAYCAATIIGDLLSSSLIAYAFAHVRFRYREVVFILVLATMMIPYQVLIIPQFLLFRSLGWIDTYLLQTGSCRRRYLFVHVSLERSHRSSNLSQHQRRVSYQPGLIAVHSSIRGHAMEPAHGGFPGCAHPLHPGLFLLSTLHSPGHCRSSRHNQRKRECKCIICWRRRTYCSQKMHF